MTPRRATPKAQLTLAREAIVACRACPRLVAWREEVARTKRRMYRDCAYWGRPVPGFGDPAARVVIVGLAPGAHGANRTGRMFTGDRSGDFLYAALHRAGLASQPVSRDVDDGLELRGAFIVAAARCAPPDNKPTPEEIARCAPLLDREMDALPETRVILALGAIAWSAALDRFARRASGATHARPPVGRRSARSAGTSPRAPVPRPRPPFAHGAELLLEGHPPLLGSYHVSQQNTQTGRLTERMFDAVLARARALAFQ